MGGVALIAAIDDTSAAEPGGALPLLRVILLILAILVTVKLGVRAAMPPDAVPASAPATSFSAGRALADVRGIAMHPHPAGSAANVRVAGYLAGRLAATGLEVQQRHYLIDDEGLATLRRWSAGTDRASELSDVIGILPGRDRAAAAVVLMAHYDTVWGSPGAADDSAGIAAAIEIARAVKARGVARRDLILLFTDGEEIGLSGARAFWGGDGLARHAGVVVNMDVRGAGGRATMFETGAGNGAMMALFGKSVRTPVANSLSVLAYRHMPNDTDFTLPRALGLPGFNFAFLGRAAYYHSAQATIDRLDPRAVQDLGDQALGIVSALVSAKALPVRVPDASFFDLLGGRLIRYRAGAGWWLVIGAWAALALAGVRLRRRNGVSIGGVAFGVGAVAWLAGVTALALTAFGLVSAARHPNYYDRLAMLPGLEAQAVLACLAAIGGFAILRAPRWRWLGAVPALLLGLFALRLGAGHAAIGMMLTGCLLGLAMPRGGVPLWGGWLGGIGVLALAALIAQIAAPTAAWPFAWPALILALAALIAAWLDPRLDRGIGLTVAAGAATLVSAPVVPLAHLAFLGIGAELPLIPLPFAPIVAIAFWPLLRTKAWRPMLLVVAAALTAAVAIAIHLRIDPVAPSVPAYALDK